MSTANAVLDALAGPSRIADVMRATGLDELRTIDTVGRLAKMGFISIQDVRDAP
jgi:hypothetical protein